jgi:hypothetical protein
MKTLTVTKRALSVAVAIGGALILGSWLFQTLYAETLAAEQRKLLSVDSDVVAYEAALMMLDAIEPLARDKGEAGARIATLRSRTLNAIFRRYSSFQSSDLCSDAAKPSGFHRVSDCEVLTHAEDKLAEAFQTELPGVKDPNAVWEYLLHLSPEEAEIKAEKLMAAWRPVVAVTIQLRRKALLRTTERNRAIFIVLYILGSGLVVGGTLWKTLQFD